MKQTAKFSFMEEWIKCPLGDILNLRRGHDLPKTSMIPGDIPVAGSNGIIGFHNVDTPISPCITIGRSGNVGTPYIYDKCWAHNTVLYIDDYKGNDPKYLYYLLKTLPLASFGGGSAVPTLNRNHIHPLEVVFCKDIELQKKIAGILSKIDDKIELNRQINDNLEKQLQALYNEWFVVNPKSDWHSVNLSEIATFVSGYSYKGNELVENSDTAMATIKNFERNGGFKIDGYKPIIPSPKLKVDQRAQLFDILVAHTDLTQNAEVIGNAEILLSKDFYKDLIFSMDLVKVNAKESFPFQFLLALLLKNSRFKSHCIGYVNGTTVLHMNKRALPDYETITPNLEDAQNINATAKAIFCQMSENLTEISNLTKMRDTLLPKLMSGELKINEIDC